MAGPFPPDVVFTPGPPRTVQRLFIQSGLWNFVNLGPPGANSLSVTGLNQFVIGSAGAGAHLQHSDGTLYTNGAVIGSGADASGALVIFDDLVGPSTSLVDTNHIYIGDDGAGFVFASPGSVVSTTGWLIVGNYDNGTLGLQGAATSDTLTVGNEAGSLGNVFVTDTGQTQSAWTVVGRYGEGHLTLQGGGYAKTQNKLTIGDAADGEGTVVVNDVGSLLEVMGWMDVGHLGTGYLTISNGGRADNAGTTYIAGNTDSFGHAIVTDPNSRLDSGWINIGTTGEGTLEVVNGGVAASEAGLHIGFNPSGGGVANVAGANSQLQAAWYMTIAEFGTGALSVTSDGLATTPGDVYVAIDPNSTGSVHLSDGGKLYAGANIFVGGGWWQAGGIAIVNVNEGGTLETNQALEIANHAGSTGQVNVTGAGALVTTNWAVNVGYGGSGTLHVNNGGAVQSGSEVVLGRLATGLGVATVGGSGAPSSLSGTYYNIGQGGKGTLHVNDGGLVTTTDDLNLASDPNSEGTVNVNDGGTVTVAPGRSVFVGGWWYTSGGVGKLNVNEGGVLNVGNELVAWNDPNNVIALNGGTINTPHLILNGDPGHLHWSTGTLHLQQSVTLDSAAPGNTTAAAFGPVLFLDPEMTLKISGDLTLGGAGSFGLELNGGTVKADTVVVSSTGVLNGSGLVDGDLENSGMVSPGGYIVPGTLEVNGDFVQSSVGAIFFSLDSAAEYNTLDVAGAVTLGGTMTVVLGFTPVGGETFDIMNFAGLTPDAPVLNLEPLDGPLSWDTSLLFSDGILAISGGGQPGDFDGDDDVDGFDFLKWQRGETSPPLDPNDLAEWALYYGAEPLIAAETVPEPTGIYLAMTAALLLRRVRRLSQRR